MKVYELMNLLEDCSAGAEVKMSLCITKKELESGGDIGEGLFSHSLTLDGLEEDDMTVTISTNAPRT